MDGLRGNIDTELAIGSRSAASGDFNLAFSHLERAHVLGQGITYEHTRIHWRMLKLGWRMKDWREIFGQVLRIVGASTKTPFGIYPKGNTGGSNVWFFITMPIPDDLQGILNKARMD